jgi:hypothetical protein
MIEVLGEQRQAPGKIGEGRVQGGERAPGVERVRAALRLTVLDELPERDSSLADDVRTGGGSIVGATVGARFVARCRATRSSRRTPGIIRSRLNAESTRATIGQGARCTVVRPLTWSTTGSTFVRPTSRATADAASISACQASLMLPIYPDGTTNPQAAMSVIP